MKLIANILWFIFGGFLFGTIWVLYGILWCITIIGIPIGLQCFKFAKLSFAPFGKKVDYSWKVSSVFFNVLWIIFTGVPMAIANFITGCFLCLTIIGIPVGLQLFKFAKLALAPFGTSIK